MGVLASPAKRRTQNAERRTRAWPMRALVGCEETRGKDRQTQKGAAASTNGVPSMRTKLT